MKTYTLEQALVFFAANVLAGATGTDNDEQMTAYSGLYRWSDETYRDEKENDMPTGFAGRDSQQVPGPLDDRDTDMCEADPFPTPGKQEFRAASPTLTDQTEAILSSIPPAFSESTRNLDDDQHYTVHVTPCKDDIDAEERARDFVRNGGALLVRIP